MKEVVHITAHLGGGVGRVLSSLAIYSKDINHTIITLEKTGNDHFEKLCRKNNIKVLLAEECNLDEILNNADIVQVDWWHHPLTSKFINDYMGRIKTRLVIWAHISGCAYPYIPSKFVSYPDEFVFSTPYSYENKLWSCEEKERFKDSTSVVVSSGLEVHKPVEKKIHDSFNIGYAGFLSYSKIHKDFVKFCEAVSDIKDVSFTLVGEESYGEELIIDFENSIALREKVNFTGYSNDVFREFETFDVFGYILNPNHYGTAENVLLEAMASGIVPIVLNQGCEKYIVNHMETGILVNDIKEYKDAVNLIYNNPEILDRLSKNSSKYIIENYNIKITVANMNKVYKKLLAKEKSLHSSESIIGKTSYEWFLSCYHGDIYNLQGNAFAETKGSAKHYYKYFSNDNKLKELIEINNNKLENHKNI